VSAAEFSKLLPRLFYDPGSRQAACESSVTISTATPASALNAATRSSSWPRTRPSSRWPTVLNGELPTTDEFEVWEREITSTPSSTRRTQALLEGFHYDAHPWVLVSAWQPSPLYLGPKDIFDRLARQADHPADRQDAHPGRRRPPVQRRHAVRLPDNSLPFTSNFLSMMWKIAEPASRPTPSCRALDVCSSPRRPRAELLDHRDAGRRLVHADPTRATAAAAPPLRPPSRRRQRGGHPYADRDRVDRNVEPFIESVKSGRAEGSRLRPPGLQELRPRAKIIKRTADEVFSIDGQEPAPRHRLKLEEIALSDEYFTSRKLYPNVDFYSGLIYQHGVPARDVPRAVRHPRTAGVARPLAGDAQPGLQDARPRQLYIGEDERTTCPSPSAVAAGAAPSVLGPGRSLHQAHQALLDHDTASVPSFVNMKPRARPRAPDDVGLSIVVEQPLVARNGRWNHMQWSRLAPMNSGRPSHVVRGEHRVEQVHVGRVGGDATCGAADRRAASRRPAATAAGGAPARRGASRAGRRCGAGRSGAAGRTVAHLVLVGLEPLAHGRERLGVRYFRHRDLEVQPGSSTWNDADRWKMALPCWMATTRRVVKAPPSRIRSTS